MENTTKTSMHPLTAIAAVSVTLFSLAGIGAITGLIPTSRSQSAQTEVAKTTEAPAKLAETAQAAEPATVSPAPASAPEPVKQKVAAKRAKPVQQAVRPAEEPAKTVKSEAPQILAQNTPPPGYGPPPDYVPAPAIKPQKPVCQDCGVIESVREIEKKGEGSGLGAAVGGVTGGVLGHQTGAGRGKDVMTVLGAIGGAFAGHQIEKNTKKVKSYEIDIRFDDGSSRVIAQDIQPAWRMGDRVKLVNGVITASNTY
ncbi:MAG: glycine zipper 2TM domain-containing protein [Burkholderiales bacterium]|nr:glycine zipper 2TM domain-containing protein [Burkholderiales bacterium]